MCTYVTRGGVVCRGQPIHGAVTAKAGAVAHFAPGQHQASIVCCLVGRSSLLWWVTPPASVALQLSRGSHLILRICLHLCIA